MGCWNKTCGLSNLHIFAGQPVYVVVLEQGGDDDRCYTTAFWRPVMLPFVSEYNDYGAGENSHSSIQYILNGLKENMVDVPAGENKYHDIEVTAAKMDEELFFEAVHENRLMVKDRTFGGGERQVDFVMLRKDIVDAICNELVIEMYVGDGKGTCGYDNNYVTYKFQDILSAVPEFLDRVQTEMVGDGSDEDLPLKLKLKYAIRGISELYEWKDRNLVSMYLQGIDDYRHSRIFRPTEAIVEAMVRGDRDEATSLLVETLRLSFIDSFMSSTRKNWAPGGHEGSQSQEITPYRTLCKVITAALDVEEAKQREWEEDEE